MPKEVIDCSRIGDTATVQVGWDRLGSVQIASLRVPANLTVTVGAEGATTSSDEPPAGQFVDLDRGKINDLIRHLRRARDAAFGRDE